MSSLQEHRRPNESCLEIYRAEIAEHRLLQWPYREIAQWLLSEYQLQITWVSVRRFCIVRKIEKGVGETASAPTETKEERLEGSPSSSEPIQPLVKRRKPRENPFHYEDTGPLQTRLNTPSHTQNEASSS
ncbi:MAG: hypothetical protein GWQ05_07945 [Verrucomicrobiaceae bacterium]|nr:hypothetical protein [Verrucomicrobiaceae bacterium]